MSRMPLTLLWTSTTPLKGADAKVVYSAQDFRTRLLGEGVFRHLLNYSAVDVVAPRINTMPRPLLAALTARWLTLGCARFQGEDGQSVPIDATCLLCLLCGFLRDSLSVSALFSKVRRDLSRLERSVPRHTLHLAGRPIYLRTDLVFGLRSGGSVGHVAGVLNHLDAFSGPPAFVTTDPIPTVRTDIETHLVPLEPRFRDFREMPLLYSNQACLQAARAAPRHLSFVYQRYSTHNYAGLVFAREREVPFILEYNGSEVWVGRNWGQSLKYEALAERIEMANLRGADLVVVVSKPLLDELVARGIAPDKILINPNGVDPDRYSDAIDGTPVRTKHNLHGKTLIGFIGTFGAWHGAEVLADAFGRLIAAFPGFRDTVRLLLIGDGVKMSEVKAHLARHGVADLAILTGLVPQAEGPAHLAACDILASPHVPNADGTPFFGSPTKLFEYMAMGKGIVASDLDQIGEILEHDRTAWMVRPGDPDDLARGLQTLIDDPDRRNRLGAAAREEVVARYTWREHTRKIIEKLQERCS